MEWMLRGGAKPGTLINELELARQFGVATNGIREFLIRFSRFGLVEKKSNSGWLFKGFTEDFALELFEIRVMFELRSARLFAELPRESPLWAQLEALKRQHIDLLDNIDRRYHDFSSLDNRFHRLVNESSPNRFIDDFSDIITFIFHYHYQWNKADEKERNKAAIMEHLAYIEALPVQKPPQDRIRLPKALAISAQHALAIAGEVIGRLPFASAEFIEHSIGLLAASRPQTVKAVGLVAVTNDKFQRPDFADDFRALGASESGHEGKQHLPHPPAERLQRRAEGSERR